MRVGEDKERVMSPMFDRLYVNETEKGGMRGPPRNKLALYEQFSIPICSVTRLPSPNNNSSSLVPSASCSDVGTQKGTILTPCKSVVPSHLSGKIQSYSSTGAKLHATMADYERVSPKLNSQSLSFTGPSSSSACSDSVKTHFMPNFRNFPSKKFGNEDEFRSPISSQVTTLCCRNSQPSKGKDKLHHLSYKGDCIENMNESSTLDLKSRQRLGNHDEESPKECQTIEDHEGKCISLTLATVREFENISSSTSYRVEHSESLKRKHATMSQESRSSPVTTLNILCSPTVDLNKEHLSVHEKEGPKEDSFVESRIKLVGRLSGKGRTESHMRSFLAAEDKFPNGIVNSSERSEENFGVVCLGTLDTCKLSDRIVKESSTALDISPDDVIGVLGENQFCKMRKAIVNQQRFFAMQVFELHRLIKVQRLIAGSPDLLLEGRPLMRYPPAVKMSAVKKVPLEQAQEPCHSLVIPKDYPQKAYSNIECAEESTIGKFSFPFVNNDTSSRGLVMQKSNYGQYSRRTSPASDANDSKGTPWCFQPPPGNLWLVPVMSPSEGLSYKPHTGPCPPTGGFMAPVYGSCGSIQSLHPGNKNYLNAAYGVPLSYQQGMEVGARPFLQIYFPPFAPPAINPCSHENPLSAGEINFTLPHQSSCNMSSQREVMSRSTGNIRAPVFNELQGNTPSSPSDRDKGNVLPLFPTAPQAEEAAENGQMSEHQTRVIKAIPRSFRSATESAARIFLSIQEERK